MIKRLPIAGSVGAALCLVLSVALLGTAAYASAPAPRRTVEVARFLGRWFEAARTPNLRERNCVSASMEFLRVAGERYAVTQTCRRARGGPQVVKAGVRFEDGVGHARLELSFFGGLVRAHYIVLDHDSDYRWAIASTSGGRYLWILSRTATLTPEDRRAAESALRSLGYSPSALQFTGA